MATASYLSCCQKSVSVFAFVYSAFLYFLFFLNLFIFFNSNHNIIYRFSILDDLDDLDDVEETNDENNNQNIEEKNIDYKDNDKESTSSQTLRKRKHRS